MAMTSGFVSAMFAFTLLLMPYCLTLRALLDGLIIAKHPR